MESNGSADADIRTKPLSQAELFSESWLFAALLDMAVEHCGTEQEGPIKSFGWRANARAMRLLAQAGYIRITSEHGDELEAFIEPAGRELLTAVERFDGAGA